MAPPPGLEAYVDCVWVYRSPGDATPAPHRVLPDAAVSLCCQYRIGGGSAEDLQIFLIGPVRVPRLFAPRPGLVMEAVQIRPQWSRTLFDASPDEHADGLTRWTAVDRSGGDLLVDRTARTVGLGASSLAVLLCHVESRIAEAGDDRAARIATVGLARLLAWQSRSRRCPSEAAAAAGVTSRHFRRAVRAATGASPKYLARVHRLTRAVTNADRQSAPRWAAMAVTHGFYDQAHLIRECRALTCRTPKDLHEERRAEHVRFVQSRQPAAR